MSLSVYPKKCQLQGVSHVILDLKIVIHLKLVLKTAIHISREKNITSTKQLLNRDPP